ncbi:hypothetical protein HU200_012141 [Digitaria exilis]|uniref:Uncharacterized protein n=1 Tax=Digitaria exilis TaxID=1010633 RepID=A0A835FFZ8_9POAL|nr:hypothetical protein HU200_012141 [Digitaria exilis]
MRFELVRHYHAKLLLRLRRSHRNGYGLRRIHRGTRRAAARRQCQHRGTRRSAASDGRSRAARRFRTVCWLRRFDLVRHYHAKHLHSGDHIGTGTANGGGETLDALRAWHKQAESSGGGAGSSLVELPQATPPDEQQQPTPEAPNEEGAVTTSAASEHAVS